LHLSSPVIGLVGSYERLPDVFVSRQSRRDMLSRVFAEFAVRHDSDDCLFELRETGLAVIERAVLFGFRCASIRWIVVDLAGMSGFSRSLDGWICNPPVRGEAPLTANPWMKGRFQSKDQ
jgi:hypothetical protein